MISTTSSDSLTFLMRTDSGFVDDPDGRTNNGVMRKTYVSWRAPMSLQLQDVNLIRDDRGLNSSARYILNSCH